MNGFTANIHLGNYSLVIHGDVIATK